ncbi:SLN13 protein, partial [Atractosteus spatula]|nr:SLN13 protein [Atractosteus spatula]
MDSDLPLSVESTVYPDQVVNIGIITLGEAARNRENKDKLEKQRMEITRAACALLNSGGGLILAHSHNQEYMYDRDGTGQDIEQALRELVQPNKIQDNFQYLSVDKGLIIFVKSWSAGSAKPRLCSLNTNIYKRCGTSAIQVKPDKVLEFLQSQRNSARVNAEEPAAKRQRIANTSPDRITESARQLCGRKTVKLNEYLDFGESVNVEFKNFGTKKMLQRLKEHLPKYISAFANTDGGFLFFGIDDKSKRVVGCGVNETRESIETSINCVFNKIPLVHFGQCTQQKNVSHSLNIIDVLGDNGEPKGFVLGLEIHKFCCIVFAKQPESWKIEGPITDTLWVEEMSRTDPEIEKLCGGLKQVLSLSTAPPQCQPVYELRNTTHLNDLQATFYPVQNGRIENIPEPLTTDLFEKFPNLKNLEKPNRGEGVLIFSRSWAVDIDLPKNNRVVCDALLICTDSLPILYTVVESGSGDLWDYVNSTAFQLKQKLVNIGGYSEWVCVIPKLVDSLTGALIPRDESTGFNLELKYPDQYTLKDISVKSLLFSLMIVVMSFKSLHSDELGCKFFNLLTLQQFQILHSKYDIENFRKLFVHGLPGTGKTVIALNLIKRIKNMFCCKSENILYLCENQPLKDFISKQDLCQCLTRSAFMKPSNHDIQYVKHIVVDEAQNFRVEDGDWYGKAKGITCQDSREDSDPGLLWIFLDYFQKSHPYEDGMPNIACQTPKLELTVGVRNSRRIHNFILEVMKEANEGKSLRQLQKMSEKATCAHSFQGVFEKYTKNKKEIGEFVLNKIVTLLDNGYTQKDIAVLCSTDNDVQMYLPVLGFRKKSIYHVKANDVGTNAIVLDSIRRFSGLESKIVFVINPVVQPNQSAVEKTLLISAVSRAQTQLYLLYLKQ